MIHPSDVYKKPQLQRQTFKVWGKLFQYNGPKKQTGVTIIISSKIAFKA